MVDRLARTLQHAGAVLAEKIYALRIDRGFTQEQLSHHSGLSRNQVQNLERNRSNKRDDFNRPLPSNPRMDTFFSLAVALQVDVGYLTDPSRPVEPVPERVPTLFD